MRTCPPCDGDCRQGRDCPANSNASALNRDTLADQPLPKVAKVGSDAKKAWRLSQYPLIKSIKAWFLN